MRNVQSGEEISDTHIYYEAIRNIALLFAEGEIVKIINKFTFFQIE